MKCLLWETVHTWIRLLPSSYAQVCVIAGLNIRVNFPLFHGGVFCFVLPQPISSKRQNRPTCIDQSNMEDVIIVAKCGSPFGLDCAYTIHPATCFMPWGHFFLTFSISSTFGAFLLCYFSWVFLTRRYLHSNPTKYWFFKVECFSHSVWTTTDLCE